MSIDDIILSITVGIFATLISIVVGVGLYFLINVSCMYLCKRFNLFIELNDTFLRKRYYELGDSDEPRFILTIIFYTISYVMIITLPGLFCWGVGEVVLWCVK